MKNEINEYDKQASDFLKSVGATIEIKFKRFGFHFIDDTDKRDIYSITIKRGDRSYTFDFGNSINDSSFKIINTNTHQEVKYGWFKELYNDLKTIPRPEQEKYFKKYVLNKFGVMGCFKIVNPKAPSEYRILCCLSVFDGDFKDFCGDFGYNEDSIKALKTFKAVQEESNNLKMLFSDVELEQLAEIQ